MSRSNERSYSWRWYCKSGHINSMLSYISQRLRVDLVERDSRKDQLIVVLFLIVTSGLLVYAIIRPYIQSWLAVLFHISCFANGLERSKSTAGAVHFSVSGVWNPADIDAKWIYIDTHFKELATIITSEIPFLVPPACLQLHAQTTPPYPPPVLHEPNSIRYMRLQVTYTPSW